MFQEADSKVGGWVDRHFKIQINSSGRMVVLGKGPTFLDWPGRFLLRKEAAVQSEIRLDLITGRTGSGQQISWVEGTRALEPEVRRGHCSDLHESGSIEHWRTCRIVLGDHLEDDLRVSNEHWSEEGDIEQLLTDLLLYSGGQNCPWDLRLGRGEGRFPQNFGRAGE